MTIIIDLCSINQLVVESEAAVIANLEVDLLSQLFGLVVLGTGVTVGGQGQEGGAHGAATRLTAEVLGPAEERKKKLTPF